MPIKTFRGQLLDGDQDTISLHTNTGSTGYRIVNFRIFAQDWDSNEEFAMKIYKVEQTSINAQFNFDDQTLLGAAYLENNAAIDNFSESVIFDKDIFNQDIFITLKTTQSASRACNYYIELEQVALDLNENTVATLQDIRNK